MPRRPHAYLWDALHAAELIGDFGRGKSFADYQSDALLRSGFERQFEIIGEALNQLSRIDHGLASVIPGISHVIAFRNILIHGYATVDDGLVWQIYTEDLPGLEQVLRELLAGQGD